MARHVCLPKQRPCPHCNFPTVEANLHEGFVEHEVCTPCRDEILWQRKRLAEFDVIFEKLKAIGPVSQDLLDAYAGIK